MATPLVGRDGEIDRLTRVVDEGRTAGATVVVRGEPGIGKTTLVEEVARRAGDRGATILAAAGVPAEGHLPYAALQQLLQPILGRTGALPAVQRQALEAAFRISDDDVPELFLVALATLSLLADAAARGPVVMVVDDAQWLDRETAEALAFVGRRLGDEPIVLVVAVRDEPAARVFDAARLDELVVAPLGEEASATLIHSVAADLDASVQRRLLQQAAGNPLALTELPVAWRQHVDGHAAPALLPLTDRLEQAFAARVSALPRGTRAFLLAAALDDTAGASEAMAAATAVAGRVDVSPAVEAGLADVDGDTVRFRHPLLRSAIRQAAPLADRHAAHRALADTLGHDPDRQVWHRAAASVGADDAVATDLDDAAARALRKGCAGLALAALRRAAALSSDLGDRQERLLRAAEVAVDLGRKDLVADLLRDVPPDQLDLRQRARHAWAREGFDDGTPVAPLDTESLSGLAERVGRDGDTDLALRLLWGAALRCFWAEPGPGTRDAVTAAAESLVGAGLVAADDPRQLAIVAMASPVARAAAITRRLARGPATDPVAARFLGDAALMVGAFDQAAGFFATAADGLRTQGRLGLLARVRAAQTLCALHLTDLGVAIPAAEEAERLGADSGQPLIRATALVHQAWLAALRGDPERADTLAGTAERDAVPSAANAPMAAVQLARGWAALAAGRYTDAYAHFARLHDPADPAFHEGLRLYAVAELAEAAALCGAVAAARPVVDDVTRIARDIPSPALAAMLRYSTAVLAGDDRAFRAALDHDLRRLPFLRARTQLAYGAWLRRHRRAAEARGYLRTARDAFDALGTVPWSERARRELRGTGEASQRRPAGAHDQLTAQELQIAQLAASGLTNREIGERLYLSHRTISSHLHRMFPRLGITSRAELRAVLPAR